jgi:hypothetical protein
MTGANDPRVAIEDSPLLRRLRECAAAKGNSVWNLDVRPTEAWMLLCALDAHAASEEPTFRADIERLTKALDEANERAAEAAINRRIANRMAVM